MSEYKHFELVHPGAPRGVIRARTMRMRKQDRRANADEMYAVIFFPKITGLPRAAVNFYGIKDTLSQTPEGAIAMFMDRIARGEKWETYHDAGHRVRRIKITDLGDAAEPSN